MRFWNTFFAFGVLALGQKPVIRPDGVVNAASYTTGGQSGNSLAPGSVGTLFGSNLASAPASADVIPLPTGIGGTSVVVGGVPAPLFYVSQGQINFQIPLNFPEQQLPGLAFTNVVVQTSAGVSDPYPLYVETGAFAIFTEDASGCGRGAVLNIAADATLSVNSPSNSASPGDYFAVYGAGLGKSETNNPPDGTPTPSSPLTGPLYSSPILSMLEVPPALGFGVHDANADEMTRVSWAGRAPGFIGVDQVNFRIPDNTREGCAVPVLVSANLGSSQPATVSIRRGGGPCVDPPFASYGLATWTKTVATGTSADGETDEVTFSLQGSPGRQAAKLPAFREVQSGNIINEFGPACPVPGYRSLDAGAIATQSPGVPAIPAAVAPIPWPDNGQVAGLNQYRAVLPNGTIRPGSFSLSAQGGADVGAFQTGVQIGSDIRITNPFAPGTVLSRSADITLNWTGGDANSWVTMRVVEHYGFVDRYDLVQTRASNGTATMHAHFVGTFNGQPTFAQTEYGPVEIVVEVDPDPSQAVTFSAPGLSLGGESTWKYIYRFGGVTIQ